MLLKLSGDIIYQIGDALPNKEICYLVTISNCKEINITLQKLLGYRRLSKKYYRKFLLHRIQVKYFRHPSMVNITQFHILPFQEKFLGVTSYIDGIRMKHLSYPVMIGYDKYQRAYISIKYYCLEERYHQGGEIVDLDTNDIYMLTIFQRYTDNIYTWCKSGAYSTSSPILNSRPTRLDQIDLKMFIQNIWRMQVGLPINYINYCNKTSDPHIISSLQCKLAY